MVNGVVGLRVSGSLSSRPVTSWPGFPPAEPDTDSTSFSVVAAVFGGYAVVSDGPSKSRRGTGSEDEGFEIVELANRTRVSTPTQ